MKTRSENGNQIQIHLVIICLEAIVFALQKKMQRFGGNVGKA